MTNCVVNGWLEDQLRRKVEIEGGKTPWSSRLLTTYYLGVRSLYGNFLLCDIHLACLLAFEGDLHAILSMSWLQKAHGRSGEQVHNIWSLQSTICMKLALVAMTPGMFSSQVLKILR